MIFKHYSENSNFNIENYPNEEKEIKRWDKLYQLDKKQRKNLQIKEQKKQEEKYKKEKKECTFKPIINNNPEYINKNFYSNNLDSNYDKILNFFSRQKFWNKRKTEKLNNLTNLEEKKELNECKFTPKIVKIYINFYRIVQNIYIIIIIIIVHKI